MVAKNIIVKAAFELQSLHVFEKRSKKVRNIISGHQVVFMAVLLKSENCQSQNLFVRYFLVYYYK